MVVFPKDNPKYSGIVWDKENLIAFTKHLKNFYGCVSFTQGEKSFNKNGKIVISIPQAKRIAKQYKGIELGSVVGGDGLLVFTYITLITYYLGARVRHIKEKGDMFDWYCGAEFLPDMLVAPYLTYLKAIKVKKVEKVEVVKPIKTTRKRGVVK